MAKKSKKKKENKKENKEKDALKSREDELMKALPKEAKEKLDKIKKKLDKFQKEVVKKFEKYIMGIALLPPSKDEKGEINKEDINVLVLVDDTDSKTMDKDELKEKLTTIIIIWFYPIHLKI